MGLYDEISLALNGNPLVMNVDAGPDGHIRIQTAFLYPDGSNIDIFVESQRRANGYVLSDFGQSLETLLNFQVKPWESPMRMQFLVDAIKTYGVERDGGALECVTNDMGDGILRMGQACLRASDLLFTKRDSGPRVTFRREVKAILERTTLDLEPNFKAIGRFGKAVRLDYRVVGPYLNSLIQTVDANNASDSESRAARAFTRWYDLGPGLGEHRAITIYDDSISSNYRDEDLDRLSSVSKLLPVSEHEAIEQELRKAA